LVVRVAVTTGTNKVPSADVHGQGPYPGVLIRVISLIYSSQLDEQVYQLAICRLTFFGELDCTSFCRGINHPPINNRPANRAQIRLQRVLTLLRGPLGA